MDNGYASANQNFNISDYKLINISHRLSSFEVRVPGWKGDLGIRRPFAAWEVSQPLMWYRAYNKSKHNRHEDFNLATFDALIDACCGLNVLLSAQFLDEEYAPGSKSLSVGGGCYTYEGNDGMEPSIGDMLRIKFPADWPSVECYDFKWSNLASMDDPFENFDYASYT